MAYVNNGTSRSLKVKITKYLGGVVVQGYPKTYDGQIYWGNPLYPTLTDAQARQLSDAAFLARYTAFKTYVEFVEAGVDFNSDIVGTGATKVDPTCLAPDATTTTTTLCIVTVNDPEVYDTDPPVPVTLLSAEAGLYQNNGKDYIIINITPYNFLKAAEEEYTLYYQIYRIRNGVGSIVAQDSFAQACTNNNAVSQGPQVALTACGDEYYIFISNEEFI